MRRFFTSLTFKIGIIIILAEIAVLSATGYFYIKNFYNQIDQRIRDRIEFTATLLDKRGLSLTGLTDADTLKELVGEELIDVMLVKPDGQILYSLNPDHAERYITEAPNIDPGWFDQDLTGSMFVETPDGLAAITPVLSLIQVSGTGESHFFYFRVGTEQAAHEKSAVLWLFVLGSLGTVMVTSMVIILSFYFLISVRINNLLDVLKQIKAGVLGARVEGSLSSDQIGVLQRNANDVAGQLQQTIENLESQVLARTRGLETIVEISQQLAGILDLTDLLWQVVTLTKETFDYYHVHIYLLENQGQTLLMAEGYGEPGIRMKQEGHSIPLMAPQSLVARAVRERQAIIVGNTREDPTWLPNDYLPHTQAEMAVPIIAGAEVLGALDVQSDKVDGLIREDEVLLQTLANQVAVAVRNARIFTQTQEALYEVQKLQRFYTGQAWEKFSAWRPTTDYEVREPTLPPLKEIATPEAITALQHKRTVDLKIGSGEETLTAQGTLDGLTGDSESIEHALATPLRLGDEIIGVLGVRDNNPNRQWTEEETVLIEAVSEQMSLALENARLFEETGRRAGRERIIADVTRQIWASGELDYVMRTAVEQLGKTLGASKVILRLGTEDRLVITPNGANNTDEFDLTGPSVVSHDDDDLDDNDEKMQNDGNFE